MNKTDKINKDLGLVSLKTKDIDIGIEKSLNDMKFETAIMILKINPNDFDVKSKTESSIDNKIDILKGKITYEDLKKKALYTTIKGVLLNGKNIDTNLLHNINHTKIKDILDSKSMKKEITNKLLNGNITVDDLKTKYESLGFKESDFKQYMEHIIYVDKDFKFLNLKQLQSAYNSLVQQETNKFLHKGHTPNPTELENIKNKAYKQLMRQIKGSDLFLDKIIIPTYGNITKARETFENLSIIANKVSAYDKSASKKGGEYWERFKQGGVFGFLHYAINQTSMDASHKQMAETLGEIGVAIGLIVGFWKMITADCLIKSDDGKCKLKGGFLRSILFLGGSEFAYNWATKGKHTLPELIGALLTGGLDKTYLPWENKETSKASSAINSNTIDQAKDNVEIRQQVTDPLLIKLLFPGLKISAFKDQIEDNNGKIDINKLIKYLEQKAKTDSKYAFGYMLVKGIKDSGDTHKQEELKNSVKEGIEMLDGYGENKKVDEIYDNEYLKRYKEVAEIKDKIYNTKSSLGSNFEQTIKAKKYEINLILKNYLSNKITKKQMIDKLKKISGLERYMAAILDNYNTGINNVNNNPVSGNNTNTGNNTNIGTNLGALSN